MLTHSGSYQWSETLVGLHVPAWWTGLRLTAAGGWDTTYRIRLRLRLHMQGPAAYAGDCEWVQKSGDWHPLPWALPASMATSMNLHLEITPTANAPNNLVTAVRIGFHEQPQLADTGRYLFCDENGELVQLWNGGQRAWGAPGFDAGDPLQGPPPVIRDYVVVPTMKWLLHHDWDDRTHRPNDWAHRVPLNGPAEPAR